MMKIRTHLTCVATLAIMALTMSAAAKIDADRWPSLGIAAKGTHATAAPLLAAAKAGPRIVAVGDHGVILLSDDGASFRQATSVPFRSLLTSVEFVDAQRGFAGGHDGVILGTQDGGENWTLLRATPGIEQPILALHFDTPAHGLAVGLYGWAIETHDAGHTWTERHIGGEDDDRHLFHLFTSPKGTLLVAGEAGAVYRSTDRGRSWQGLTAPGAGSLWRGLALDDGTLLVCGMRGHLYRSRDDGQTWEAVASGTTQSLTSMAQIPDGSVVVVGMNGTVLTSTDAGASFSAALRERGEPLTDVIVKGMNKPVLLSLIGPLT